jgi:hypothetical protein
MENDGYSPSLGDPAGEFAQLAEMLGSRNELCLSNRSGPRPFLYREGFNLESGTSHRRPCSHQRLRARGWSVNGA